MIPKSALIRNKLQVIQELKNTEEFKGILNQFNDAKTTAERAFKEMNEKRQAMEIKHLEKKVDIDFVLLLEKIISTLKASQYSDNTPVNLYASIIVWKHFDTIGELFTSVNATDLAKVYNNNFPQAKLTANAGSANDTGTLMVDPHLFLNDRDSDLYKKIDKATITVSETMLEVAKLLLVHPAKTFVRTHRDQVVNSRLRNLANESQTTTATLAAHAIVQSEQPQPVGTLNHMFDQKIQELTRNHDKQMAGLRNQLNQLRSNNSQLKKRKNSPPEGTQPPPSSIQRSRTTTDPATAPAAAARDNATRFDLTPSQQTQYAGRPRSNTRGGRRGRGRGRRM